jgi:O-acetyl-ADP-ribose deacetylase (regulator of RNase III)
MLEINIKVGDIAQEDCDAVVNAANNHLWMGSGVAGALKKAGGEEIEREAIRRGPVKIGDAVVTGAGKLKARYVIHAVVMGQDLRTDAEKIRTATHNCLLRAMELKIESLVFPALGTGVGGFPMRECARLMLSEICSFISEKSALKYIVIVLPQPSFAEIFSRELDILSK